MDYSQEKIFRTSFFLINKGMIILTFYQRNNYTMQTKSNSYKL